MVDGYDHHPGLVVEDRDVQLVGAKGQSGHHRVHPVVEQCITLLVPVQVQGLHVGVGVLATQRAHRRGDDQTCCVADDDAAGLRGAPGLRGGLGGRAQ